MCWARRLLGPSTSGSAGRHLPSRGVFYQATFAKFKTKPNNISISKYKIQKKKKKDFASKMISLRKPTKVEYFSGLGLSGGHDSKMTSQPKRHCRVAPPRSTEMENPLQHLVLKKINI